MGRRKLTIEYIRKYAKSFGYTLLSTKYIGANSKLKFMCPKGHIFYMRWGDFQRGQRCSKGSCGQRKTIEHIREQTSIIATGYKLLSTKYINCYTKLEFMCPKGHVFWMTWNNFQQGQRCSKGSCGKRITIEHIRKYAKSFGYTLISTKYIGANSKLKFMCPKGHVFLMRWSNFLQGKRCPECWKRNYTPEELTELCNYQSAARSLTEQNYKKYYEIINPKNLERNMYKYHLDHIFPVIEGFRCNVPIKYIAHPSNLQMLSARKNRIKHDKPWQTERGMYKKYADYYNNL